MKVKNQIAEFSFSLIIDDERTVELNTDGNQINYYALTHIKKLIKPRSGAKVVFTCNFKQVRQGGYAYLTKLNNDARWLCSLNGTTNEFLTYPSHYFVVA